MAELHSAGLDAEAYGLHTGTKSETHLDRDGHFVPGGTEEPVCSLLAKWSVQLHLFSSKHRQAPAQHGLQADASGGGRVGSQHSAWDLLLDPDLLCLCSA